MSKPGMLQFNCAGSWRNVCTLDLADESALGDAMAAAALLMLCSPERPRMRIMDKSSASTAPAFVWSTAACWADKRTAP